ncbi:MULTISPECIES: PAS domain S-box protein [Trichocoleus]|uniref:histidine kinase n=1 Tax=Trichocoleus desertorum GB2-A4 TaxID=2933944 RepID=A0ABV0JF69_9CYAN|nr:PAS domain S-box protein [Trichocoleus sp. FACHB-46]MBD1865590.1 PAS domain S-box protein [Trichocoleus sp. FACHB-46]
MRGEEHQEMPKNFLGGGGEIETFLRSHDWSQTPLGAVETWSDDLKTAVQILLTELDQTKSPEQTQPDAQEQQDNSTVLSQAKQLNAFRVKLAEALRPLTDASEIQAIAARILGEALGASRVIYVEVEPAGEEVIVHCNYTSGVAQLSGRYRLEDYRRNLTADHQVGHTQVVTDIPNDPKYTDVQKTRYREIDIAAHIDVPLIKNNQFVALLAAQQSTPRQWTETEIKLVEETAEQTWAAAERALAEAALRESEAKYRTLFESIDQGFCVIEVLFDGNSQPFDYRFLEINPAFEKQTGLIDAQGKRIRELAPNHEGHWFEIYGNIALTGEPKRFENRAAALNRWYDVYAFRIGHPDERKVAILFNDISGRKRVEDERKQAETALQQSEAQSKNILESITDGFFALDQDWRFTYVNPQAERILDLTPGDLLGKVIWEVYPGTVGTEFERAYRQAASKRVASSLTSFYPDHNCWYEAHAYPAADGITVYFRNVTEQVQAEAALRESEEKTRNILESIEEAFFALDQDWRFTYINRAAEVLLDRTPGDLIGKNFWEEYPGAVGNELAAIYHGAMHDRVPGTVTTFYPDHDCWYYVRTYPAANGIAVYFNNVTAQIQAETALRESEERFRNMADNAPVMVRVTDSTGACTYLSRSWYEFTGQTEETGLGFGWLNAIHPEDCEESKAIFLSANERYEAFRLEYRLRAQDGEYRWAIDAASPWFGVDGQFKGFIGSVIDISDRKQAEAIITTDLENTRLLRDLSTQLITEDNIQVLYDEIMATAITLTRADAGTVQILDKATQELVLLASKGFDQTTTDHFDRVNASSNTSCGLALLRGTRAFIDFDMPECDDPCGALRIHVNAGYRSAQSTPLISRSGRAIGVVSTHWRKHHRPTERELRFLDLLVRQAADLIEQRQTESERRQVLEREQAAREEAERANRIKDEFLAVLSHELRSPLSPILGWTQLLQNGKLNAVRQAEALKTIERNAKLQKQLIEDLLDISGIMQGKLSLTAAPVSLTFVISAAIETVRLAAEAKHIRLQLDLDHTVVPISGDAARLQQVFWNLLSNAVKFTPSGGQITVELRQLNQLAQIRVIDTGKGINPQFLPYLFEYFRQEDGSTTRKFGGLGLGLAIARQIVEMHGGTVRAASQGEGQGATFTVQLPAMGVAAIESEPVQTQIDAGLPLEGIHILLVDDEPDTREVQAFLLEQNGAKVKAVASGLEALLALERSMPDVLVSDIGMAEMNGYMLLQQIRSRPPQYGGMIPAIALTAYAAEVDQQKALQVGFQAHITKPVEPDTLVKAITDLL